MCLVVLAVRQSPDYPLVVAGNRDEFHARPTADAGWWTDRPDVLGGRDLEAGGSWLALHRRGRFATVTNYRDADSPPPGLTSRGQLVADFVEGDATPRKFVETVDGDAYAGFNLIVGDRHGVAYASNRGGGARELPAGVYGLSNALLDGPWHKVEHSKRGLLSLIRSGSLDDEAFLGMLNDRTQGPVDPAVADRLGETAARAITAPFVVNPEYGTRCSTLVTLSRDSCWHFVERRFDREGNVTGESVYDFEARSTTPA